MYIRSGMFSFGLTNFLSLSDRMSDMLKKFSTSLGPLLQRTFSSDWQATATNCMHSSDLKAYFVIFGHL